MDLRRIPPGTILHPPETIQPQDSWLRYLCELRSRWEKAVGHLFPPLDDRIVFDHRCPRDSLRAGRVSALGGKEGGRVSKCEANSESPHKWSAGVDLVASAANVFRVGYIGEPDDCVQLV